MFNNKLVYYEKKTEKPMQFSFTEIHWAYSSAKKNKSINGKWNNTSDARRQAQMYDVRQ